VCVGPRRDDRARWRALEPWLYAFCSLQLSLGPPMQGPLATSGAARSRLRLRCDRSRVHRLRLSQWRRSTKYAHPAELLVLRANGTYTGYHDSISEPNRMARSTTGEVVAAHNDSIVRVTASALTTLVSQRQLDQLFPGAPGKRRSMR